MPQPKFTHFVADDGNHYSNFVEDNSQTPSSTNNRPVVAQPAKPTLMQQASEGLQNLGKGAAKGLLNTSNSISSLIHSIPGGVGEALVPASGLQAARMYAQPHGMAQKAGYGAEQVGEFMVPGGAEEAGAAKVATLFPKLGRAAKPLARVATSALSSGAVNAAQGGSPVTGALMGAGGQVVGQGLKAMAPAVAEGALNIRKLDRAYGKNGGSIGRAILDETQGIRPRTVAESAQTRLNELNPQLNSAADLASVRPNQARGLLAAPNQEIPLHNAPDVAAIPSKPIVLNQLDRPIRQGLPSPSAEVPMAPGHQAEFPQRLPSGTSSVRLNPPLGDASGMGPGQYIGEIPGERGGMVQTQGVLIRPAATSGGEVPSLLPNNSASLKMARGALSNAFGNATRQGERTTVSQLQPMATHLGETMSGEQIPENITPRQLLDLKRGFGNEFIHRWNPETMTGVKGTAAQTYHAMGQEFNRTVPEAQELNSRISNLIPVAKRAASEELNAPTIQRAANRFAAHTGALTGAGVGGAVGYKEGGVPGAIAGGLTGVVAPELIASPEGQLATARLLNKATSLRPIVGSALQLDRKRDGQ